MSDDTAFDRLLNKEVFYFIELKRLYKLQMKVIELCEDRPIKNDLIYQQLLFSAVDGLFVRLDNFHVRLLKTLEVFRQKHLDNFKRNNKRALVADPSRVRVTGALDEKHRDRVAKEIAYGQTKELQGLFDKAYDKLFPGVRRRNEGRPNHDDFNVIMKELVEAFGPIRAHRDTVVAHWDKNQQPATVQDLNRAMEYVENLLGSLYYISKLGTHPFELGGIAADVNRTSRDLAELILGAYRVRRAKLDEMESIYLMGFDAWGEGQTKEVYLKECRESPKYAEGGWYVLEDRDGKPVSSLIAYEIPITGEKPATGLGSIATQPNNRKKGLAGKLIWEVLRKLHDRDGIRVAYLWADIKPEYYKGFDFVPLPARYQTKPGSVAMIRCHKEKLDVLLADSNFKPPAYF